MIRRFRLRRFRLRRRWFIVLIVLPVALVATIALSPRLYSAWIARERTYAFEDVPERPVAIIFGAQVHPGGRLSAMLADRVEVGVRLYQAGKVQALLFTGDNSEMTYNEPEAMRRYALNMGVPDDAIVLDYAGFRTYDSCYRARDIFKVEQAILVTQGFHLDRALMTCNSLGIDAVGVAADFVRPEGYRVPQLVRSQIREIPATALAALDLLRGEKPTFLGDPLPIRVANH
jgi:SanA protein